MRRLLGATLLVYGLTAWGSWRCEQALFPRVTGLHQQDSGDDEDEAERPAAAARASRRLGQTPDSLFAEYGFQNFNRDRLQVRYQVPKKSFAEYCDGFWYSKADLDAIDQWHNNARQGAYKLAVSTKRTQAQLDAAMANLKAEAGRKRREYLASKGFRLLEGNVVSSDVPAVVRRSVAALKPVALALDSVSVRNGYDSETLVGAAVALVQTALAYKIPPMLEGSRHTGGMLPPAMSMVRGWGDCDTKTGVLASILSNWSNVRIVGVAVPEHYLMAILRLPNKGDAFIEYQGLRYVLIEPAGPAWLPPGQVGEATMPMLQAAEGFRIEPFTNSPG
ncbi:MAG: hypothetical protein HY926_13525 [Elusimicrobia bacterium]|nr:hypothetical protein [Elusimicrobiota bacterium]